MPEIAAVQTALVRDRADDRARPDLVPLADRDAVGGQVLAGPAGRPLAIRLLSALAALLRRWLGHQELRPGAGLNRQCGSDIGHRDVIVAPVLLDEFAVDVESRTADRLGDRLAEFLDPLGVDVVDRRQIRLGDGLAGHLFDGLEQMTLPR